MAFSESNLGATITIGGNAEGAAQAAATTADALKLLQDAFVTAAGMVTDLNATVAAFAAALADASAAATGYAGSLSTVDDAAVVAAASSDTMAASITAAGGAAGGASEMMGGLTGGISGAVEGVSGFIERAGEMVGAIAAWSIIQDAIGWVHDLSTELFDLNVNTERSINAWQYLFSGPNGPSKANATDLTQWSSQFSMGIPFTRQDLMQAITFAGSAQLNAPQTEQFMPFLSDITSTYGSARGTTLSKAMQAVWMAMMGRSYMLKMDLGVSPEELIPYGLQATGSGMGLHITDPNSVITALEKWAVAKHISNFDANGQDVNGAAGETAQTTWWGGLSSAKDKLQNFLLSVGGTDLNGQIRQGSFFDMLKKDLFGLMDWFDTHQSQINQFADVMSKLVGTVVSTSGGLLGSFFDWLGKIGAYQDTMSLMTAAGDILLKLFGPQPTPSGPQPGGKAPGGKPASGPPGVSGDGSGGRTTGFEGGPPGTDAGATPIIGGLLQFGQFVGLQGSLRTLGQALKDFGDGWQALGKGWQQAGGPQLTEQMGRLFADLFTWWGQLQVWQISMGLEEIGKGFQFLGWVMQQMSGVFDPVTRSLGNLADTLQRLLRDLNTGNWNDLILLWEKLSGQHVFSNTSQGFGGGSQGGNAAGMIPPGLLKSPGSLGPFNW